MTGLLELRTDTCLLVANLLEITLQLVHGLLVLDEFLHGHAGLFYLGDDLLDAQVVGLTHQVGDQIIELLIFVAQTLVVLHHVGYHHGSVNLVFVIHAEGYTLQPHHTTEILFQYIISGVVTTWTEEAIRKGYVLKVGHKTAWAINGIHSMLHLFCDNIVNLWVERFHASEECFGYGEEPYIVGSCTFQFCASFCSLVYLLHLVEHLRTVVYHHGEEAIHLQLSQHAVDVEVIKLQIEVGGYEVGELPIVVLLVYLEQLCVSCWYNGKAVFAQMLTQLLVKLLNLRRIQQVAHVDAQSFGHIKVLLLKFSFSVLQALDESLFLIVVVQQVLLFDHTIVEVTPRLVFLRFDASCLHLLIEDPHQ